MSDFTNMIIEGIIDEETGETEFPFPVVYVREDGAGGMEFTDEGDPVGFEYRLARADKE